MTVLALAVLSCGVEKAWELHEPSDSLPSLCTCSPLLGGDPAVMCVEGVECMNDDPSSVDVLYAKVFLTDQSDR